MRRFSLGESNGNVGPRIVHRSFFWKYVRFCATDKLLELGDMEVEIIEERNIDILGRGVDAGQKALQILPDTVKFKIVERE